jgi:dienelactone hydrolase
MRCAAIIVLLLLGAGKAAAGGSGAGVSVTTMTASGPEQIPATLLKPEGDGPFPAVVIAHDCSGLGARSSGAPLRWGEKLLGQGYVVILPDSFVTRGFPEGVCMMGNAPRGPGARDVSPRQRRADVFAALAYLRGLAYVDSKHVGLMGGSHGGSTTLVAMAAASAPSSGETPAGFAAAVALYPGCGARAGGWSVQRQFGDHGPAIGYSGSYQASAPLLILIGEKDDWTPAAECRALVERAAPASAPLTLKVYPGAQHSFDSDHPTRYLPERHNITSSEGRGATTGGDPAAWADAIAEVTAFFARYLREGQ